VYDDPTVSMIRITRKRSLFIGLTSTYFVIIDGAKSGRAPRGRVVDCFVAPGSHEVFIQTWPSRNFRSNSVRVTLEAGTMCKLICETVGTLDSMRRNAFKMFRNNPLKVEPIFSLLLKEM
jgi:hypothetical protein